MCLQAFMVQAHQLVKLNLYFRDQLHLHQDHARQSSDSTFKPYWLASYHELWPGANA